MVEFCCRVNVCFHILISGWKRGGAGGGGCWCTLTAKIIMSWAIKTQKILVDYWHKSSEFLPGDKLQTVFFFLAFLSSSLRHSALLAGFEGLILREANYGRLGAVPPGRAQQKKKHSHTSTHVCHRPPETAAPLVSSRSHEERQCGWMWFRYWKKKKKGVRETGCRLMDAINVSEADSFHGAYSEHRQLRQW